MTPAQAAIYQETLERRDREDETFAKFFVSLADEIQLWRACPGTKCKRSKCCMKVAPVSPGALHPQTARLMEQAAMPYCVAEAWDELRDDMLRELKNSL